MNDAKPYCKKASFANEDYALKYLKKLKETSKRNKVPQTTYLCKDCLTWHLTSVTDWNEDSVEVQVLKKSVTKLERKLIDAENRVKRLEREKAKHHEQVYELNQKVEAYKRLLYPKK